MRQLRLKDMRIIVGICIISLFSFSSLVSAGTSGKTSAEFLNIPVDARSSAMGGSFTAVANNASASYWNPGGLVNITSIQVQFSHFAWYQDITYEYFAAAIPVSPKFTIAASASYVNYGTIQGYDIHDIPTGKLNSTYDMSGSLSFGFRASDDFHIGTTVRFINIALDNNNASAFAFDAGAQLHFTDFSLGAVLSNAGGKIRIIDRDENLPTSIKLGAAVYPYANNLIITAEAEKQLHGELILKGGTEYSIGGSYFFRSGYEFIPGQEIRTLDRSFSFGLGTLVGNTQIDYTYSPSYNFGNEEIHRFTLTFNLK
ncbi:MAG: PorV/PorQ family protein [candidate division Zixibacteria bacterium]|nr:PorV/PorQ family protein [candidate division Zixibacteria bacterium]